MPSIAPVIPGGCTHEGVPANTTRRPFLPTALYNGGNTGGEAYSQGLTYFPAYYTNDVYCWDWSAAAGGALCTGLRYRRRLGCSG